MRYLSMILLSVSLLVAHEGEHIHFFSSWHLDDFLLFLGWFIGALSLYRYLARGNK